MSLKKFNVHLDLKSQIKSRKCVLFWVNCRRHITFSSPQRSRQNLRPPPPPRSRKPIDETSSVWYWWIAMTLPSPLVPKKVQTYLVWRHSDIISHQKLIFNGNYTQIVFVCLFVCLFVFFLFVFRIHFHYVLSYLFDLFGVRTCVSILWDTSLPKNATFAWKNSEKPWFWRFLVIFVFLTWRHLWWLWHAGLFTRSDLDRNSCTYNLGTFEFKHFGITRIMARLYSFKFLINNQPH